MLYQLLCSHIQKGSVIYEKCLLNGIRVDRNSFICLYPEESGEEAKWYTYLTEELIHQADNLDVYSTYYTESGFLFLVTSVMNADQIHDSYRSLQADQTSKPTITDNVSPDYATIYPKTALAALQEAAEGEQFEKMGLALQDIRETIEKAPVSTAVTAYLEAVNIFTSVVMPLSKPIIAILTLYYAVGKWNDFFNGLIYVNKASLFPLQMIMRDILIQGQAVQATGVTDPAQLEEMQRIAMTIKYGAIIVSSLSS